MILVNGGYLMSLKFLSLVLFGKVNGLVLKFSVNFNLFNFIVSFIKIGNLLFCFLFKFMVNLLKLLVIIILILVNVLVFFNLFFKMILKLKLNVLKVVFIDVLILFSDFWLLRFWSFDNIVINSLLISLVILFWVIKNWIVCIVFEL